jgi:hypothetical protein
MHGSDRSELMMLVRPPHTMPPDLPADEFTPAMVEAWIELCRELGVTAIRWMINYVGKATYHSRVLPVMKRLPDDHFEAHGVPAGPAGGARELFNRIGAALARFDTLDVGLAAARRCGIPLYADLGLFDLFFPGLENDFFEAHPELWLRGRRRQRPSIMHSPVFPSQYQRLLVPDDPYQPGQTWYRGVPCYAEPAAQDYWLRVVAELMDRGVECFCFSLNSHVNSGFGNTWRVIDGDEGPDSFGFNPAVVHAYEQRYGVDILNDEFDAAKLRALQGEFFTGFLRRLRRAIGPERRLFAATHADGWCGYGAVLGRSEAHRAPAAAPGFRMDLQWRTWLEEGLADGLIIGEQRQPPAGADAIEQVRDTIRGATQQGTVLFWRNLTDPADLGTYRSELAAVRAGAIDGYGVKELSPFYHSETRAQWLPLLDRRCGGA